MKTQYSARVLAVCGKGGVGKTSLSAMITAILTRRGKRVLAIDADPAVGLASALGIEVTRTVDDIRNELIQRVENGKGGSREDMISHLDYDLFNAIIEKDTLAFLAIGRPEKEGCYCQVNDLLKDIILKLADNFEYVIIDGEAGIEQINRRVMERVDILLLLSDASMKGIRVADTISDVSETTISLASKGLIINRLRSEGELKRISLPDGVAFYGYITEDDTVRDADIDGVSIPSLTGCRALSEVETILVKQGILDEDKIDRTAAG